MLSTKRIEEKECKIDMDIYNPKYQELIDSLVKKDYHERPNIEKIFDFINSIKNEIQLVVNINKEYIGKEFYFLSIYLIFLIILKR